MSYIVELSENREAPKIVVVGCGGTGGFVAEGLCRLLLRSALDVLLCDHDRVELHNLRRQNFFEEDLGKFKSEALANRLARKYGRPVAYSVYPYDRDLLRDPNGLGYLVRRGLIIGCVDQPESRTSILESLDWGDWWLDAGNGHQSGQVLIGNTTEVGSLKEAFNETYHTVSKLPVPSLQVPELLVAPTGPVTRQRDCAEEVDEDDQSPVINQAMATVVLDFVYKFLTGKLTWMGEYLDLEAGTLAPVPAEPSTVARMFSLKVNDVCCHEEGCHIGGRRNMPGRRQR